MIRKTSLLATSALLFNIFSTSLSAQGGDNCTQAAAAPVPIPFASPGTTCGATNDYFGVGNACGINNNTWGIDWVYYFIAPSSGNMNAALLNMTPNQSFSSLSVWDGCPGSGNCISGLNAPNVGNDQYLNFSVTAGQGYYILVDNLPPPNCFNYFIRIDYESQPATNPQCTNLDFENNSFNGWHATVGNSLCSQAPATTPTYNTVATGFPTSQHTIVSGNGTDPCGGFPVVYPGGSFSLQLGDGTVSQAGGASIEQSFVVSANEPLLLYHYALVIEDGGHSPNEQPFFKCELLDSSGQLLSCGQYEVTANTNMPGFLPGNCPLYTAWYKPWTSVATDLSGYINQKITVRFTVGDCCNKGHFSYAYLDAECQPLQLYSSQDTICSGSTVSITAPAGFASYQWSTGDTTQNISEMPLQSAIYSCTVTSVASTACTFVYRDTITVFNSPTALPSILHSTCNRHFLFTDSSFVALPDSIVNWFWNFGDNTFGNAQSMAHQYATSGIYYTALTVTASSGCSDTAIIVCLAQDSSIAVITSDTVCEGQATQFIGDTLNADILHWDFGDLQTNADTSDQHLTQYTYPAAGIYTAVLIASGPFSCADTAVQNIIVKPKPIADFYGTPDPVTAINSVVQFADLSSGAATWEWDFGDNTFLQGIQSPVHNYYVQTIDTISFPVTLIVSNTQGCRDTTSRAIRVYPEFTFWAPNSFTPNGDGVNDLFLVYGIGWSTASLILFDRWGNVVHEGAINSMTWNGTDHNSGSPCQEDVYVWRAEITEGSGQVHVFYGSVTLLR